jgi:hypothetical protein
LDYRDLPLHLAKYSSLKKLKYPGKHKITVQNCQTPENLI